MGVGGDGEGGMVVVNGAYSDEIGGRKEDATAAAKNSRLFAISRGVTTVSGIGGE